ncbi:SDR family oxidoreductase [Verminephrobacter aporrectodeae subsp. tuberculatae]|nr:SDR family oxidoreductase [Verminephrobacter aporrectodeae subsp. tuberculatae]MCW5288178.1 SDR family oxidoreductase [Verminephrobacter aporrectodeae subsp. tuberculatae]
MRVAPGHCAKLAGPRRNRYGTGRERPLRRRARHALAYAQCPAIHPRVAVDSPRSTQTTLSGPAIVNPLPDLENTTVVVTGAGRGIGAATVHRLLQARASVLALVQPDTGIDCEISALATAHAERLRVLAVDVRSSADVAHAVTVATRQFGGVAALVNNAGMIQPIGRLDTVDPDAWEGVLAVNAGGAMRCTRAFLPLLLERRGTIVNMSSGAAYRPLEGWSAYCASKAALVMLSRATELEYRALGLRVFSLGIPPTDTAMQGLIRNSGINDVSKIPQRDLTAPTVTAAVVAWLCGPDARDRIEKIEIDVRDPEFAAFTQEAL